MNESKACDQSVAANAAERPGSDEPEVTVCTDDEIITQLCGLAARIDVATAQLLALVGEVDAREAWGGPGIRSCAHWLSWRCGVGPVAARAQVRVARALRALPRVREEFAAGRLSYAKVRAITRIADDDNEADLVELAQAATAAQLERTVRAWRRVDALESGEEQRRREVRWHWGEDGMFVLRARLTPEEGAVFMTALDAVRASAPAPEPAVPEPAAPEPAVPEPAVPEPAVPDGAAPDAAAPDSTPNRAASQHPSPAQYPPPPQSPPPPVIPVEQAIPRNRAEGFERSPSLVAESPSDFAAERTSGCLAAPSATRADALIGLARAFLDPDADVDRDPEPQLVVHLDSRVLAEDARAGLASYQAGGALDAAAARRLACDCALITLLRDGSDVLDVARPTRRITRALRRALLARDGGCLFPACDERRVTRLHAHHVWHWADGGPTELANLALLCRFHHRCVHEDGYQVAALADSERFVFTTPSGVPLPAAPAPSQHKPDLPAANAAAIPQWAGDPLRLDYVISLLGDRRTLRRQSRSRLAADFAACTTADGSRSDRAA